MKNPIDFAISHARLTLAFLAFLLLAGFVAYMTIPKEAEPDVRVPIVYVQLSQRGISPEDAERLLLRPMETQLKSVANVKEMRSTAFEGGGFVLLEFQAGFDSTKAVADVRAKVDDAKRDLPKDADQPTVREVNLSLFPVLVVGLTGDVPERTLLRIARGTKNAIEAIPGVLSADLKGARDEVVEIRRVDDAGDVGGEFGDNGLGRAGGREHKKPRIDVDTRHAAFSESGHLRQ